MAFLKPRMLVIAPAWIGDMVMLQSLLLFTKQLSPNTQIDVLAPKWALPLLRRMPEVHEAIEAPFVHKKLELGLRIKMAKEFKKKKYDQAIIINLSLKSASIPFLARIPHRIGWLGEFRFGLLNDFRILKEKKYPRLIDKYCAHALPKNAPLPKDLPFPKLTASKTEQERLVKHFHLKPNKKPLMILCPGAAGGETKRWPAKYYGEVAAQKIKEGWQVWLLGSKKEKPIVKVIQKVCEKQCVDLSDKTTIEETIDLLDFANVVVCNDTGLMHIAAALDKPIISIFGSSSPSRTPPLSHKAKIISLGLSCQPCLENTCPLKHMNCLNELKPEVILNALKGITAPAIEKARV